MLNYIDFLRMNVGIQLRKYRTKKRLRQSTFETVLVDRRTISCIENGKTKNNKKEFISEFEIDAITKHLGITAEQLFWGEQEDRENLVKLIIVAMMINDSNINPFVPNKGSDKFFNNADYNNLYNILTATTSATNQPTDIDKAIYRKLSQDLREQLSIPYFVNRETQKNFYQKFDNSTMKSTDHAKEIVDSFIKSKPVFIKGITITYPYEDFITAFNAFWERTGKDYMILFEKDLFFNESDLRNGRFNELKNFKIFSILISTEFQKTTEVYYLNFLHNTFSFQTKNTKFQQDLLNEILEQIQK